MTVTTAILTGVLVLITGYYAKQTHDTVLEMRAARGANILPRLVPTLEPIAPDHAFLRVVNAGTGPALNVELDLILEPNGPSRRWKSAVVVAGEKHDFLPAEDGSRQMLGMKELSERYTGFQIKGSCKDAFGEVHVVDEVAEARDWWHLLNESIEAVPQDRLKDISKTLEKHLTAMEASARALRQIADAKS